MTQNTQECIYQSVYLSLVRDNNGSCVCQANLSLHNTYNKEETGALLGHTKRSCNFKNRFMCTWNATPVLVYKHAFKSYTAPEVYNDPPRLGDANMYHPFRFDSCRAQMNIVLPISRVAALLQQTLSVALFMSVLLAVFQCCFLKVSYEWDCLQVIYKFLFNGC